MMPGEWKCGVEARFWRKVTVGSPDECWLWNAGRAGSGYGQFFPTKGRPTGAHRYSWQLANGRPPAPGMVIMHSCDERLCVNPRHLSEGTYSDNAWDASLKGRRPGNRSRIRRPSALAPYEAEIVAARYSGATYDELADLYGVAPSTVWRFVRPRLEVA